MGTEQFQLALLCKIFCLYDINTNQKQLVLSLCTFMRCLVLHVRMFSCIIQHYWHRSNITYIHNFHAAAPKITKKPPVSMALQAPAVASHPFQKGIDLLERNVRNATFFMLNWLSLSVIHRICITAGLFDLLGCPCLFYYFPRKSWILLFHLEISALQRMAISPTSLQLANIREIICKPLKFATGFHITFFTLFDLFLV